MNESRACEFHGRGRGGPLLEHVSVGHGGVRCTSNPCSGGGRWTGAEAGSGVHVVRIVHLVIDRCDMNEFACVELVGEGPLRRVRRFMSL